MYIYKFTHLETGRCYIGQTIQNPNHRKWDHICSSKYTKNTYHFHNALKKYGPESFSFEVIAEAKSIEELNVLEDMFISLYDSINNGFNIRNGGGNKTHHPDSIKRMKESQKAAHTRRREQNGGIEKTKPHKSHATGWKHSEESIQKRKEWSAITNGKNKGKTWKLINGKRTWVEKEASV
jgi:group I intron endonuclease